VAQATGVWRYALHDLLTGDQVSEHVPFKIDSFSTMLNEAGTLSATIPLGDAAIRRMRLREVVLPRRTTMVLHRDDTPVWEGIIWTRRRRRQDNTLVVAASELRSYYGRRKLRPQLGYGSSKTLSFTQTDLFAVFRALLADCHGVTYLGNLVGDLGLEVDVGQMAGVLIDRLDTGTELNAYHGYEFQDYAQALDELATTDPGMEWRITPYRGEDGSLRRRLLLGSPHLGIPAGSPTMATLEYPGAILDYEWPDDGENSASYVAALGVGDGDNLKWAEAINGAELTTGYPLTEAVTSHKNDSSLVVLAERATADLAALTGDRTVPTIELAGFPPIDLGDYVQLRISDEDWWPGSSITPYEPTVRVVGKNIKPGTAERTSLIIEEPRVTA
jgi:hypothetical protein